MQKGDGKLLSISKEYWSNFCERKFENVLLEKSEYKNDNLRSEIKIAVDKEISNKIKAITNNNKFMTYTFMLTIYKVAISRTYNDIAGLIGIPQYIKGNKEEYNNIFLVTSNKVDEDITFKDTVRNEKESLLNLFKYQFYPLDKIYKSNFISEKLSVFCAMKELHSNGQINKIINLDYNDLTLIIDNSSDDIILTFNYGTNVNELEIDTIKRIYINILNNVMNELSVIVKNIEIISECERSKILNNFNNTNEIYPKDKTVNELFEEQVNLYSTKIAVVNGKDAITYKELNEKANSLARRIINNIEENSVVGVIADKSLEMVIAILAIIKAGCVYLPLDPKYPVDRIEHMIRDTKSKILLCQPQYISKIDFDGTIMNLQDENLYTGVTDNLHNVNESNSLAYIIYTSGSTGNPKGVMVEHRNIIRLVRNTNYISFREDDKILQTGDLAFDASTFEIWGSLLNGIEVHLVEKEMLLNIESMERYINENNITILFITTALFNSIAEEHPQTFDNLRVLLTGGEVAQPLYINNIFNRCNGLNLANIYGPTENTTFSTRCEIKKEYSQSIPIGKPISNSTAYIVDKNNRLQPVGVCGELCVGGDGVARGYLNAKELTDEKFIENKFVNGERMYRTGDLARWLPDGNIEFLGRIDHQVKIRGFRIELGEIETKLVSEFDVKEAIVIDKKDKHGNKYLCAYVVSNANVSMVKMKDEFAKKVPEYMVPKYFINLEKMPLNSNGKIDRRLLPEPNENIDTGVKYVAPRNEIEEILINVWEEILRVDSVGIDDDFFRLGGDSIKAIQVCARLNKYNLLLVVSDLFANPNIRQLSSMVKVDKSEIIEESIYGNSELSPIQKWFFEEKFEEENHFNQSFMMYSKDRFDNEIIEKVFTSIVKHHDALRSVFRKENGEIIQKYREIESKLFDLEIIDFMNVDFYEEDMKIEINKIQKGIDLENGPLVKLGLFKTAKGDHLLIAIHHLVVDGVSWRILLEDFENLYKQIKNNEEVKLPKKTNSFKKWSEKIREYSRSNKLIEEISYWSKMEKTHVDIIKKDFYTVNNSNYQSKTVEFSLSNKKTEELLKNVNKAYNTEINDILLTALILAVYKWKGNKNTLINLEGHGREELFSEFNITRTVGWFTTFYPIPLSCEKPDDLGYMLKSIKDNLRKIPNKGVGYNILKYMIESEKINELIFKLKPQISFNYLGQFDNNVDTDVFEVSNIGMGDYLSKKGHRLFDININGSITNEVLNLTFEYNNEEFRRESIEELVNSYSEMLTDLIEHCVNKDNTEVTPSDFIYKDISIEDLDCLGGLLD